MATVWIYVDTSKKVEDADHLKVFATSDLAEAWFEKHNSEGVAFKYEVEDGLPRLSKSLDKILNEERIGLAKEQRRR